MARILFLELGFRALCKDQSPGQGIRCDCLVAWFYGFSVNLYRKRMEKKELTLEESIYSLMRTMDKQTKLVVPLQHWALVRNYAGQLQRDFDVDFEIHRMKTTRMKYDLILVTRSR